MKEFFETLPESWQLVTLEEVCWKITDGTHKTPRYVENGVRFISIKNIRAFTPINWEAYERFISREEHEELTQRCKPEYDDILFPRIGTLGFAKRIDFKEEVSIFVGLGLAKPIKTIIQPKYLEYWMNHPVIHDLSHDRANGTGRLTLPLAESKKLPVPLAPFKEQSRIVEKLEELLSDLDDGVAELKAAQAKLTQYRQSLLKSAVEGGLTADWRAKNKPTETGEQLLKRILAERQKRWEKQKLAEFEERGQKPPKDWQKKYPEPVAPDTSELPELPEGWVWASLDQCTADAQGITDGPFGSNLKTAHYTKSGPRVIRLQNIGEGIFHDDKAHISETHYLELTKHSIESGDTVVAMMGEVLPRACTIPDGVAPGIVKADCARVRVNGSLIEPDLLPYFLNSEPVRERTKALVKGIGRPRINLSHIRATAIPVAPRLEQIKMLELFRSYNSSVDAQLSEVDRSLSSANAQRKNILKEAFEGLLVQQDPKDETAAQLLHNIKINRDKFDKKPKPRRSKNGRIKGRKTMKKLEDVLAASKGWLKAEDAFKECGATDGTSTAVIEELYYELRVLDKNKRLDVQRRGDSDWLRLKDGTNR